MWFKALSVIALVSAFPVRAQEMDGAAGNEPVPAQVEQDAMSQYRGDNSYRGGRNDRDWDRRGDRRDNRVRDRGRDHWDRDRGHDRDHDHRHRHRDRGPSFSFWYYNPPPVYYRPPPRPYWYDPAPYQPYVGSGIYLGSRRGRLIVWSVLPVFFYDRLGPSRRGYHERAYEQAMTAPVGQSIIWNDGGDRGRVQVTREGYAGNRACREFQQEIVVDGRQQNAYGTACQAPDGSWELVGDR